MASSDPEDLAGFIARAGGRIVGAVFFSRLSFEQEVDVFILAPVAVASAHQGRGIGQALIEFGLREINDRGVKIVTTYGDPAFYSRVGFMPLSQDLIRPPFQLSQPEGWLGQSLVGSPIEHLPGTGACVPALDDPAYW